MLAAVVLVVAVEWFQDVKSSDRIIGGTDAGRGSFSWMVELTHEYMGHWCGGSLVMDGFWVLTAAHCVRPWVTPISDLKAVVGEYQLSDVDGGEEIIPLKEAFLHPDYDLALVRLSWIPTFNRFVSTIELSEQPIAVGNPVTVSGWGMMEAWNSSYVSADTLQQLQVPVIDPVICNEHFDRNSSHLNQVLGHEFCVGYSGDSFINVCFGDSGSPGIFRPTHREPWKQYGIVSWAENEQCQEPARYAVFVDVSSAYPWIQGLVQGYSCGEDDGQSGEEIEEL